MGNSQGESEAFWLSDHELDNLGITHGTNVHVSRQALLLNASHISIGDNSRIDAFSIISAGRDGIEIGRHVHVGAGCYLFGSGGKITLEDFSGLSARVCIFSANDDYKSGFLNNPTVPDWARNVEKGPVEIGFAAIVGCGAVILPKTSVQNGAAVGAHKLVHGFIERKPERDFESMRELAQKVQA